MKIVILRISVLLLVVLCGAAIVSCSAVDDLLGNFDDDDGDNGNGGEPDPDPEPDLCELLSTAVEVQDIQNDLAGDYCLEEDIDLSTITDFVPIGSVATPFNGTLNGNNKKLMNLTINRPTENDIGIFGVIGAAALIKDLIVEDANVTGSGATGILVGSVSDADQDLSPSITNVRITGTSSVTGGDAVGGMIGAIKNVDVTNTAITIADADVTVAVDGASSVGGLVGQIDVADTFPAGDIEITNVQSAGTVTGSSDYIGGIVGYHGSGPVTMKILNSSSSSTVESEGGYVGGLVGRASGGTITSSYATSKVTGAIYVGGLAGSASAGGTITSSHATGLVTGAKYAGGLVGYTAGTITSSYATGKVIGTASNAENYVGGLVGRATGGTITSSYATGLVEGAGYLVGGLAGAVWRSSSITSSYATGQVSGSDLAGGLVGKTEHSDITSSYATGSVTLIGTTGSRGGGLVGHAYYTTITSSYATGNVTGATDVGGLVGRAQGGTIILSYFDKTGTSQSEGVGNVPNAAGVIGYDSLSGSVQDNGTDVTQSDFSTWDFNTVWYWVADGQWPLLAWQ